MKYTWFIIGALVVITIFSGFFTVPSDSVGMKATLGKFTEKVPSGPHLKLPLGLQTVEDIPVLKQQKMEFGFRTIKADIVTIYDDAKDYSGEALMLTGDLSIIWVELVLHYQITDPYLYLYNSHDPLQMLYDVGLAESRKVIGNNSGDEAINLRRYEISAEIKAEINKMMGVFGTGITIIDAILQEVQPPPKVKPSYAEVTNSKSKMKTRINEARQEANERIPLAEGNAQKAILEAEGYKIDRINRADGLIAEYLALAERWKQSPATTEERLYNERITQVLKQAKGKYIVDASLKNLIPLITIDGGAK